MNTEQNRLYRLLPYVYRWRDAQQGEPLKNFLKVIEEQVEVIEQDFSRSYDNWFIETCEDWVVPYLAELVGYRNGAGAIDPRELRGADGALLGRMLAPRADVARSLAFERRKGTLPLLEEMASAVAGWPSRAVEGYRLLSYVQPLKHQRPERGRTIDLRESNALHDLGNAFDSVAHTVDLRRPGSHHAQGLHNIPSIGVFVWRLRAWPITSCQAYLHEGAGYSGRGCYTFSVLGRDTPLFVRPDPEPSPHTLARKEHVPGRLTRHVLERDLLDRHSRTGEVTRRKSSHYYGIDRTFAIWIDRGEGLELVPHEHVISAELTDWKYSVPEGKVLVDPELGRFKTAGRIKDARVSWHYGFSAAIGGGEYDRQLTPPSEAHRCYLVDEAEGYPTLEKAIAAWREDMEARRDGDTSIPPRAIIEIAARGCQYKSTVIELGEGETLILRGANRNRPVLWLSDAQPEASDALRVIGTATSRFILDGLLIAQRGVELQGPFDQVIVRHCTLAPPKPSKRAREGAPSILVLNDITGDVLIERSILGPVTVSGTSEPTSIAIRNSILDAGNDDDFALSADGEGRLARAELTVRSSTIIGRTATHSVRLAENSIFSGEVQVARRQPGCMRFCYVPVGSRTPRRFRCQPDLVLEEARRESPAFRSNERNRVRPLWTSRRHGDPGYGQLHRLCAPEIRRGADDEGEMGVLHEQYLPQREAALSARLADSVPVATEPGIFFVT